MLPFFFAAWAAADLARLAPTGPDRARVVHAPLVAGPAVRGAADGHGRRLLGALPDAARPGDRPSCARWRPRSHSSVAARCHDPAARGTARGRTGEPAGAAAGDGGRAGRRADHHRRAQLRASSTRTWRSVARPATRTRSSIRCRRASWSRAVARDIPSFNERPKAGVVRMSVVFARKDGSTFRRPAPSRRLWTRRARHAFRRRHPRRHRGAAAARAARAGERLSALGEFVSGVAHEINNPLQSVIGTLELLLDQPHDPAVRVDLERTRFEAGRAGRIVRNL